MSFAASRLASVKPSGAVYSGAEIAALGAVLEQHDRIRDVPGLTLDPPGGAFYGLIGCEGLIGATTPDGATLTSDADVTAYLLSAVGVAAGPGSAYDLSPFFRISTAASEDVLNTALNRISDAVANLKGVRP